MGFGEPPLWPLPWRADGREVATPEGMRGRIVAAEGQWELQWSVRGAWAPRLRWAPSAWGEHSACVADFVGEAKRWARQPLGTRLICCALTRDAKVTIAGDRLKITSPRFGGEQRVEALGGVGGVRAALEERFGISRAATEGLSAAALADAGIAWSHL